ncbi:MAG: response regulator transcription factor [Anaerolineales bacterium]|nr:response regulator transcription factor [Anaerolineales bacterium]
MENAKILVVDDDPFLLDVAVKILSKNGFEIEVANSGPDGLRQIFRVQPDLVLLDIMMPGMDGIEVLKRIREMTDIPVIMLSALNQTNIVAQALELGADDFVRKPFEKDELLARMRSLLRRAYFFTRIQVPQNYSDGHLSINLQEHRIYIKGRPIRLTVTEYGFLEYLYLHSGTVCTYQGILENIWGGAGKYVRGRHYVHVYVDKLRRKIEINPDEPKYLITEHGVGYRFDKQNL